MRTLENFKSGVLCAFDNFDCFEKSCDTKKNNTCKKRISSDHKQGNINYLEYENTDFYNKKYGENTFVIVESNEIDDNLFRDIDYQDIDFGDIDYAPRRILFVKISVLKQICYNEKRIITDEQFLFLKELIKNIDNHLIKREEYKTWWIPDDILETRPATYGKGEFYKKLQCKKDAQILIRLFSNFLKGKKQKLYIVKLTTIL